MTDNLNAPGRTCPLDYRYSPDVFRAAPVAELNGLDVLYVAGGLYGNELALERLLDLFAHETGRKALVFNGDFHWFDADAAVFARVQAAVLRHHALRGNVETELARPAADAAGDAGCGCAYPDWVDDAVVQRSNRIHQRLQAAVSPAQQRELAALPMWLSATVGGMRVGIVHGDAQSLAGWGFAQELWAQASHRAQLREWFEQAGVDAFACSHTCLPLFGQLRLAGQRSGWVLNNGAAGMPNFRGDPAGLFTRMARLAAPADVARSVRAQACWVPPSQSAPAEPVHLQALALEVDATQVQARFVAQWPPGSDAHASYFSRIAQGPDYRASQIVRQDTPLEIDTCSPS